MWMRKSECVLLVSWLAQTQLISIALFTYIVYRHFSLSLSLRLCLSVYSYQRIEWKFHKNEANFHTNFNIVSINILLLLFSFDSSSSSICYFDITCGFLQIHYTKRFQLVYTSHLKITADKRIHSNGHYSRDKS